jgi:hypothetical protein
MSFTTGTAGVVNTQTELYIEGAPQLYISSVNTPYLKGPDSDGYYWGLSGTTAYPIYQLGCYEGVSLGDNVDLNDVRCDVVGSKDVIIKRNYLELKFTLKSFFPLKNVSVFFGTDPSLVTTNLSENTEKMGLGQFDNSKYYKVYFPKVYDSVTGDFLSVTFHRAKITPTGELTMQYGNVWQMPITIRGLADESKPTNQTFATILRADVNYL